MSDFHKMSNEFLKGSNAKKVNNIINSTDGSKLSHLFDQDQLQKAVKSGDTETLKNIVSKVLSTGEGQKLAQNINNIIGKK